MSEEPKFKIGDKVVAEDGWRKPCLVSIEKITPQGSYRASNGNLYDSKGRLKTSDMWHRHTLKPLTQKLQDEIDKNNILNFIRNINWSGKPLNLLKQIYKLVQEVPDAP